jgi:hypothetical protein
MPYGSIQGDIATVFGVGVLIAVLGSGVVATDSEAWRNDGEDGSMACSATSRMAKGNSR